MGRETLIGGEIVQRLSSRKLALALAGLAALVGVAALEAFYSVQHAKEIIGGIVFIAAAGIGAQTLLDNWKRN